MRDMIWFVLLYAIVVILAIEKNELERIYVSSRIDGRRDSRLAGDGKSWFIGRETLIGHLQHWLAHAHLPLFSLFLDIADR